MAKHTDNLGPGETVPTVVMSAVPDMTRVKPTDWSVLALVDGQRTVDAICAAAKMSAEDAREALARLLEFGMIEVPAGGGAGEPAATPSSRPAEQGPTSRSRGRSPFSRPSTRPKGASSRPGPEAGSKPPMSRPSSRPGRGAAPKPPGSRPFARSSVGSSSGSRQTSSSSQRPNVSRSASDALSRSSKNPFQSSSSGTSSKGGKGSGSKRGKDRVRVDYPENWPVPVDQFIFDPLDLELDIPVSLEKRKQILYYHYHLKRVSYYVSGPAGRQKPGDPASLLLVVQGVSPGFVFSQGSQELPAAP